MNVTLSLAMESICYSYSFMWLNKAETWKLSDELELLDYIRTKTLTCYNGIIGDGCG